MIVIKVNRNCNYCSSVYLSEVTRKNMVGKSKVQSPERYAKKSNYHPLSYRGIDIFRLLDYDQFVIKVPVGDYDCIIAYKGILNELETVIKSQAVPNLNLQTCIRVLQRAIDNKDILVDCTCPDFCLEENTQIKLFNGEVHTIKEIKEKFDNGEELWVYSADDYGYLKPGKVTDVWISGQVNEMVKVILDNGESIMTTPNHRYMMRDGSYTVAEELKSGDDLMPNNKVDTVKTVRYVSPISVYDLTVDEYNNFLVSAGVVLHNCYRFAYWASKFGYKYGELETRPPKITNPNDKHGAVCKHLLALLSSKRWLVKVASQLNAIIRDNLELFNARLGLEDEDEMFVNDSGVHSNTTRNRIRRMRQEFDTEYGKENNDTENTNDAEDTDEIEDTEETTSKPVVVDMSDDLDIDDTVEEEQLKGKIEYGIINS